MLYLYAEIMVMKTYYMCDTKYNSNGIKTSRAITTSNETLQTILPTTKGHPGDM